MLINGLGLWLLEEAPRKRLQVAVARGLVELSSVQLPVVVLNTSEETVTVYKNMDVANLQEVDELATYELGAVDEGQATAVEEDKQEVVWDLVENSSADLRQGEVILQSFAVLQGCNCIFHPQGCISTSTDRCHFEHPAWVPMVQHL